MFKKNNGLDGKKLIATHKKKPPIGGFF